MPQGTRTRPDKIQGMNLILSSAVDVDSSFKRRVFPVAKGLLTSTRVLFPVVAHHFRLTFSVDGDSFVLTYPLPAFVDFFPLTWIGSADVMSALDVDYVLLT